ncbi:MAG: type II CAAX endopeptidase family protein [Cyanobacteria bacterium J06626_14]
MRRIILGVLTILVLLVSVGPALIGSLEEPQIGNQLELYQTDLLLQARELKPPDGFDAAELASILGGPESLEQVTTQYEQAQQRVKDNLTQLAQSIDDRTSSPLTTNRPSSADTNSALEVSDTNQPSASSSSIPSRTSASNPTPSPPRTRLSPPSTQEEKARSLSDDLALRIGLLYAVQNNPEKAIATWQSITETTIHVNDSGVRILPSMNRLEKGETADTLIGLWQKPTNVSPDAEFHLRQTLTGWFRTRALEQLYTVQNQTDALEKLRANEQETAQATFVKLALLGAGPVSGCLIGVIVLIVLGTQRILKGKEALLAVNQSTQSWLTPWDWEITWQVLLVGFFFLGQIILPISVSLMRKLLTPIWQQNGWALGLTSGQATAITTTTIYVLMAIASILVLYFSIKPSLPLPEGWFNASLKSRWFLWGLGGYFCAVPLVIGVSIVNQQIWQGRGGSNPLLEIVLTEGDTVALGIFFFTAAIAAPIFEEILFRGFLLPSLTRYMPMWGAIILSSIIFATAHLSFSEVLPLTILGMVLGFVYARSRNLLSSMMVHSLWNSATMIGLLVLGSGIN